MKPFPQFLEQKFLDWQNETGKRRPLKDFALYLGIKPQLLSMWMNATRKPSTDNVMKLRELLGVEVLDALGLPRPDPLLDYVITHWDRLRPERQVEIREEVEKYLTEGRTVAHEADQS